MEPDLSAADDWLSRRTPEERKRRGQWVTPWWVIELVIQRLAARLNAPQVIMDPACGDGRWLLAASRAWPGATLVGLDNDPLAIEAARHTLGRARVPAKLVCADALAADRHLHADLIIGNPPYVRPQHLPRAVATDLWSRFATATDKADLFVCFVERALQVSEHVALVLPANWLSLASFGALRALLVKQGVDGVFSLPRDTFDATVDAVLLIAGGSDRRQAGTLDRDGFTVAGRLYTGPRTWSLHGPPPELDGRPLGTFATVHMGVVCGDYDRYVHRGRLYPEDRPTCRGRHVHRWHIEPTDEHIRYLPRQMLERKPYVAPKHAGLFDVPEKIVVAGTSGTELRAAMDDRQRFPLDSCYVLHALEGVSLWGLLGLLLSTPVARWYGARYKAARVKGVELARIPLPDSDWSAIADAARAHDEAALDLAVRRAYRM